ncbi:MAG: cysteine desulfurase family protein [Deltaproteobacteria bacterium]
MIYLDYNASTPIAPEVREAMLPYLVQHYGNPSSAHWAGTPAARAVARARAQVAALLGCSPREVVFTSGGTEANNTALKGVVEASGLERPHIVTTAVEHPAVVEPCRYLERHGVDVTFVGVDGAGMVDPDDIAAAIRPETVLVSVMHANNEVGTIQPIAEVARVTREAGVLLHSDGAQSVGKIPTRVDDLGVDLLSIAAHKFYGPKGVGALYVREGTSLEPLMHGAGHEDGRRAGTENVLLDIALGAAAELAADLAWTHGARELRDWTWLQMQDRWGERVALNGHPTERLPNTLNVSFLGRDGREILAAVPDVAASTGSACHSGGTEPSPVLAAMGVPREAGAGAVRLSLGRMTTREELETLVERLAGVLSDGGGP